jgi:hypothetical protein
VGGEVAFDEQAGHLPRGSGDAPSREEVLEGDVGTFGGDSLQELAEPRPHLAHRPEPATLRPEVLVGKLHDGQPRRARDVARGLGFAVEKLRPHLDRQRPLGIVHGEDPAPDARTGLQHHDVSSAVRQRARRSQSGRSRPDDDRVDSGARHDP